MDDRREDEEEESNRQTRSLAALAIVLALALAALFFIHHLKRAGDLQDCLMAGRTNCDKLIGE